MLPGLILRVGKKRRTWQFRYHAGGSYHRKPLGHFPAMELGEARKAGSKLIERLDSEAPPPPSEPHPPSADTLTLGSLLDRYEAMRVREGQRIKALPKMMRSLRRHLKPYLSLPADQFSKVDLRAVRDAMIEAGTMAAANRLLGALGPAMRWAAEEDLYPGQLRTGHPAHATAQARARADKKEIAAIWRACDGLGRHKPSRSYAPLVKFLLVTGQRRDQAASLRYGHILNGVWRRSKTDGRAVFPCRRWRRRWSDRATRGTMFSEVTPARFDILKMETHARRGVRCHRLAAA